MNKLSAVIITFNEERNIERCLLSLKPTADEIIVLDSFSTDRTREICHAHKVQFFEHKFDGHIQQKNRVAGHAKHDLILSLDADEALSDELTESIIRLKNTDIKADAFRFNRLNYYCGKPLRHTWQPDYKIRLWKKNVGRWQGKNPHDTFMPKPDAKIHTLKGNLLHYSFDSVEQHIQQINYFSGIGAEELYKKGKKSGIRLFASPLGVFIKQYIILAGFLDGYYGFVVAVNSAFAKFSKYAKLKSLYRQNKKNER